jgi:putative transposase
MIKEQETGTPTAEVCRRHGLSPAAFYKFKAKYEGMNVSDKGALQAQLQKPTKISSQSKIDQRWPYGNPPRN